MKRMARQLAGRWRSVTLAIAYCLAMVVVGLIGVFGYPNHALTDTLGWVTQVYSIAMIIVGVQGTLAILFGARRSEMVAFLGIGFFSMVHAILIFAVLNDNYNQIGWRIVASGIGGWALGSVRWEQGITRADIEDYVANLPEVSDE